MGSLRARPQEHRWLPAVIPLVVHANPDGRSWNKPTDLADLIDVDPATREARGDLLPSFRFLLDDLTVQAVSALCARDLTPAARVLLVALKLATKNKHLGVELLPVAPDLNALVAAPGGTETLAWVATYIMKVGETPAADLKPLLDQLGPDAKGGHHDNRGTTSRRRRSSGRSPRTRRDITRDTDAEIRARANRDRQHSAQCGCSAIESLDHPGADCGQHRRGLRGVAHLDRTLM
ncbi:Rpn family recombination-promoting nuclease/putative transposase [Nocardia sp. NPDC127526]|uniref:Rpn family recombination-promoting nuclease/putative transposase n=1 Tax=Nocardia sp. NPDC127526 TaxID=3345393 RepID=UPI003631B79E